MEGWRSIATNDEFKLRVLRAHVKRLALLCVTPVLTSRLRCCEGRNACFDCARFQRMVVVIKICDQRAAVDAQELQPVSVRDSIQV